MKRVHVVFWMMFVLLCAGWSYAASARVAVFAQKVNVTSRFVMDTAGVSDVGNFGKLSLSNAPVEFNRRIFVPPTDATAVVINNPGRQSVHFDAVQLKNNPDNKPVQWLTGTGASDSQNRGPFNLPPEVTRDWSGQRSTHWAQDGCVPGPPKRGDKIEARPARYRATGAPMELLIEGVPRWAAISPEPLPIAVPVVLRVPMMRPGQWIAKVDADVIPVKVLGSGEATWAELAFDIKKRAILTLSPSATANN